METIIWDYQKAIISIYKQHGLTSLRGLDDEYKVNGKQILLWHSDAVRKGKCKYFKDFDFNKNFDDLLFCSDEVMYFLAIMYLHRPYMNNPIENATSFGGGVVYPNIQNLHSKRYSMFSSIVSEKLYNYWDRIGDLIAAYFPDIFKPKKIYFANVIERIGKDYGDNENYKWLKAFKEGNYRKLSSLRNRNVHHTSDDTSFKYNHLDNSRNLQELKELTKRRDYLADFYKEHISFTLNGFEKTLLLIEKITEDTLEDVE